MYSRCSKFISQNIGKVVSGKELNKHCNSSNSRIFKKILREDMTSNYGNFQYKIGENTDHYKLTMNKCSKGGLYFTTIDNVVEFMEYGSIIVDVKIPDTTKVFIENGKLKAQTLIIENPIDWNTDDKICLETVKKNGIALRFVKDQTDKICLEAVKQDGWALEYVKNQTDEICLEAVRKKGYALKYVKKQTLKICLEAVRQNGYALEYVKEQTPKICIEAVIQHPYVFSFIKF